MRMEMVAESQFKRPEDVNKQYQIILALIRRVQHLSMTLDVPNRIESLSRDNLQQVRLDRTEISEIIKEVTETSVPLMGSCRGPSLHVHAPRWTGHVIADRRMLSLALFELIENAIKYSYAETKIEIETHFTKQGYFALSVRSQGLDLPPIDRARLFEFGFRGSNAAASSVGSGIGLTMVAGVMRAHNGSVRFDEGDGDHITFTLEFPLVDGSPEPIE